MDFNYLKGLEIRRENDKHLEENIKKLNQYGL